MGPHQLGNRRNVIILSLFASLILGAIFVFAPMSSIAAARQALAARVNTSPTAQRIFSLAPAPIRRVIKKQLVQPEANKASGVSMAGAAMFAPVTITKNASPASGGAVGQGQIIAYTIQATNGASSDTTVGAGGFVRIIDTAPAGTLFTLVTVEQQPQFGSAWSCTILGGGASIQCNAGDGAGAGIDTFTTQEFVRVRAEATVGAATAIGTTLTNTATYQFDNDGGGLEGNATSNATVHTVRPTADLSLVKFVNAGGGNNGGSVTAGGTSVAYAVPGVVAPAPGTGNIDYQLLIGNGGPENGSSVLIQDSIPNNTTLVPLTLALDPATVFINGVATPTFVLSCIVLAGNVIECRPGNNAALNPAWTADVMPAGFSARLNYRVSVPANVAQGTIIQNEARISSQQVNPGPAVLSADPNAGNNASTPVNTLVNAIADLGIDKVTSNATPTAGGAAFSYTLTVTNFGPSNAQNVVVSDPLPPGIIFQNVAVVNNLGGNLICSGPPVGTNGTVQCTSGNYPALATSTITIVAQVVSNVATGVRTNTATVGSATTEATPNTNSNTDSLQQNIVVDAPLSITKAGPATVCAGDTITYHITVLNGGSSTALNATISDPLPANTTFVSQTGTGAFANSCSHNGGTPGTVTCASVDVPSGQSTLDVTVKVSGSAPAGPLGNTATITTAGTGTIAVGTSTTTATVNRCSDLEITKTASPATVSSGQDINYTITVQNNGPSDILGPNEFNVTDVLPAIGDATFKPGTVINAPGFSCNGLTAVAASFPCIYAGSLLDGASVQLQFTLTVNPAFNGGLPGGVIVNTAGIALPVGAPIVDSNSQNNSSTVTTPVLPSADLSINKSALTVAGGIFGAAVTAGGGVSPGFGLGSVGLGEIEYTLTYRNNGPGDATNVHIRDVIPGGTLLDPVFLPIGVVVTPIAGPGLTCQILPTLNEYQLDCTPTNGVLLPVGANGTIQFSVRVPENILDGTVIRNTATINSEGAGANPATPDAASGNNTSQETQNIVRTSADLAITKVQTPPAPAIIAGQPISYTLTVTNNGVSDARDVVIKDVLPAGVQFGNAVPSDPSFVCSFLAGTVTCQAAVLMAPAINLPPIIPPRIGSNVVTIVINALVSPGLPAGNITNNATVEASTQDPVPANNAAQLITPITNSATVTITKVANPNPVVAGTNLTYTLTVQNNGPSTANGVVVTDPLPAETQFVSATGTGVFAAFGSCVFVPGAPVGTVTCTSSLPGQTLPPGINPNNPSLITITVLVPSSAIGPNIGPNTATVVWTNPAASTASSAAVTVALARVADLQLDKTCTPTTVAGQNIDCTIKIKNAGPSDVKGNPGAAGEPPVAAAPGSVVITDTLPAGANYLSVQVAGAGGFTCTFAAPVVTCLNAAGVPGDIPAGGEATLIIKSTTPSSAPAGSNSCDTAVIAIDPALHPDPDPVDPILSNNTDTACAVVTTSADLSVNKTSVPVVDPDGAGPLAPVALPIVGPNVPPGSVNAGGYIRYDVPFGNGGSSDAINVLLNDVIPANTAFVGALTTGGAFVPAAQPPAVPFSFTIGTVDGVAPLGPAINFNCTVIGAAGSQQIFCVPQDNDEVLDVPPYADGILPAGYTGQLTFFVKVNESVAGGSIITNPASITSGLCPNGAGPAPPTWPPIACAGTPDPNPSNNTSQITANVVVASSNLSISKIVQSAVTAASNPNQTGPIGPATAPNGAGLTGTAVVPGTVMTYRVTITNNGPSDVSNIRLTDLLPSGLETPPGRVLGVRYISVNPVLPSGATFTCAPPTGINPANNPQSNGGSIVCTAPLLSANAPNNVAAIDVTVFIDAATRASLVNTATVDATINNFNLPVSGTAVLTTPVAAISELAVTKTHTPDPVIAGTSFTYTVTLTNNGLSTANNVSLVDTFPAFQKLTNVAIQQTPNGNGAPNFSCVAVPVIGSPGNTTSLTCTAPELPPNRNADNTVNPSGTVVFVLTVLQDQLTPQPVPVSYLNCVTATSDSTDAIPANNTNVCDTVNIGFQADPDTVTLRKVDTPDPVIAGNLLTYTITATNNGPSGALDFRITDPLPSNVRFISAVASAGATLVTPAVNATGVVTATWDAAGGTPGGLTAVGVVRTLTIVVRVCPDVVCNTVISNTATSSSLTADVRVDNDSDTATTTVQSQSDLSISKSDSPDPVKPSTQYTGDSLLTYTINFSNAGPSNSANTIITDVLPPGFTVVSTNSTIPGTIFNQSVGGPTGDQVTVTASLGVLGAANQCAAPALATSGTITIVVRIPNKFPNGLVTNTATISTANCLADPNPADNTATAVTEVSQEPQGSSAGLAFPANAEASDDKSGSVLIFPHYTSNASVPAQQNTTISLTNTGIFDDAVVHLFVVDGATCSAQDVYICLTRNQTVSFLASDFDPGVTGYIIAIAVNPTTGRPVSFNCLIGDAYVKHATGHRAAYGAVAVSTLLNNPTGVDPLSTEAVLKFDGVHYNRLPRILAADGLSSPGEGNSTIVSIMAVGGNMSQSGSAIGSLTGNLFDDRENNYSFNEPAPQCVFTRTLSDSFPRTFTPFSGVVAPGGSGWMKYRAFQDIGILGIMLNFNPNTGATGNAFNSGHLLHGLTLTTASTLTIPVGIPECQ